MLHPKCANQPTNSTSKFRNVERVRAKLQAEIERYVHNSDTLTNEHFQHQGMMMTENNLSDRDTGDDDHDKKDLFEE